MIWQFVLAGLIAALAALMHGGFGEKTNIKHLWQAESVPLNEKLELRATWHSFTAIFMLTAIALGWIALPGQVEQARMIAHLIAIIYGATGLAFLIVAIHGRQALKVPQWGLLFVIAALTLWGSGQIFS
ncbi:MAG: hypothetical protein MUF87_07480 [Anaerolineae bacterium]|nr:hypothetical protein [Anaerolineae bacterium]